jgi:hypothetical protein
VEHFVTSCSSFTARSCQLLAHHPRWRTTPRWLFTADYSVYSQLPYFSGGHFFNLSEDAPYRGDRDPCIVELER